MVYFCYVDESGTPEIPGNTSHYVLCGISIPVDEWKKYDAAIDKIKQNYGLINAELHTGWMLRLYKEQQRIPNFESLDRVQRKSEVDKERKKEIYRVKKCADTKALKQLKKNYKKTEAYVHLTYEERCDFIRAIADKTGSWRHIRIFAECIDKVFFSPSKSKLSVDEQAFEQIVSRFEHYMDNISRSSQAFGLVIHDNNETVSKKHTKLMKQYHKRGTFWTSIKHIIETPLYVNSDLTGMVQIADLCAYAIRRYLENKETDLFDRIKPRFGKQRTKLVGVRHFSDPNCDCEICKLRL